MSRDTVTITTPVRKTEIVLNTYITGREFEYVQEPIMKAMDMKASANGVPQFGGLDISKITESNHRMLEKMLVSVGGVTENLVNSVLDLPHQDYQYVVDKVNEITKKNT